MALPGNSFATPPHSPDRPAKKVDPPGGTTGRVGCGTGVDEAPVPDAESTTNSGRSSVAAGTHAAHVVAVSVELANPAAAAIAVVIVAVIAGGDCGADDG